jgi:hypothetical protein
MWEPDVSQSYGPPWPVPGIALPFLTYDLSLYNRDFFFPMALQPFLRPWPHISVSKSFYTDGKTHWTSDQSVARPLPIYRTTQTQKNAQTYKHPCLE